MSTIEQPFLEARLETRTGPTEFARLRMRALFECRKRFGPLWQHLGRYLRFPGLKGLSRFLHARLEVLLRQGSHPGFDSVPRADALPAASIPSVAAGNPQDRFLAEIDQDGFVFAMDSLDRAFFGGRDTFLPRLRHRLHVVLRNGVVCLRKQFLPAPRIRGLKEWVWSRLGLYFYNEAAALLRLWDCPWTPRLLALDVPGRTLYMDYLAGETLRHQVSRQGEALHDLDLARDPVLQQLREDDRDKRESDLFAERMGKVYARDLREVILNLNHCGVAPLDVKLGNVLIGAKTGKPYWIDFEQAYLDSYPQWQESLHEQYERLNERFGLGLVTRKDVQACIRSDNLYSPVDLGLLGCIGDVSDVSAGEGRWRWLLKNLNDWKGQRVLDLGANNCLYALRMLQAGAAEVHCVERDPEFHRQALFMRSAVEQLESRALPLTIYNTDIHAFLTSQSFPNDYFDVTQALCSIYYLDRDRITQSMRIIARISRECWLQANIGTPRDSEDLKEKASVEFLEQQLRSAGFDAVTVIRPKGYIRPLLLGRKRSRVSQ